jgi:CheY-like chemotaxis protein
MLSGIRSSHMNAARRVLVADDSLPTCAILKAELISMGFEVDIANNGAEAVRCALAGNYDLIMMDVYMPIMTGLEATRQIIERARASERTVPPIVAITAGASREQCEAAGMIGYLEKPIMGHMLRRYITEFFSMSLGGEPSPKVQSIDVGNVLKSRRTSSNFKKNA